MSGRPVCSSRTVIVRPVADRMPLVTVSVNVPSGLPMAMTVWPTWSALESPMVAGLQARRVDLDQGEVLVVRFLDDGRRELAAVGQLDGQRLAAGHDVLVGQDVAVRGQDHARPDARRRDLREAARRDAIRGDGHDRVADRGDDVGQVGARVPRSHRGAAAAATAGAPAGAVEDPSEAGRRRARRSRRLRASPTAGRRPRSRTCRRSRRRSTWRSPWVGRDAEATGVAEASDVPGGRRGGDDRRRPGRPARRGSREPRTSRLGDRLIWRVRVHRAVGGCQGLGRALLVGHRKLRSCCGREGRSFISMERPCLR